METWTFIDTSVFAGCSDPEFARYSKALFDEFREGQYVPMVSDITLAELEHAPAESRQKLFEIEDIVEIAAFDKECDELAKAYSKAGDIPSRFAMDMQQIATAAVRRADLVISWDFLNVVHIEKVRLYNGVNLRRGYAMMEFRTPREVTHVHEDV